MMFDSIKKLLISVKDISIFHWLVLAVLIWTVIHLAYVKFTKLLLRKIRLATKYVIPLTETIWHLCFIIISLLMIFGCLEGSIWDSWVIRLDNELTRCKVHEEIDVPGIKTIFILHTSFAIHDIANTWSNKGFKNLEFLEKQVLLAIFVLTYYSKCPLFGLSLVFLLHWAEVVQLLSKLYFVLSSFTRSFILHNVAKGFCSLAVIIWIYTFLYIYPVFLTNNKSMNSTMTKAEINMLIVMDFLSWVYLLVTIVISMFSRIMVSFLVTSPQRPRTLEYFLFGCDPWILWLTRSQNVVVEENVSPVNRSAETLRQTIHCVMVIKRRLRRIRRERESRVQVRD